MEISRSADGHCRACLELLDVDTLCIKHDLFDSSGLAKKFIICTSLMVEAQDGFPKHLCDPCYKKVNDFHQFQSMCVDSVQRYREILKLENSLSFEFDDDKPLCELVTKFETTFIETDVDILYTAGGCDDVVTKTIARRSGRKAVKQTAILKNTKKIKNTKNNDTETIDDNRIPVSKPIEALDSCSDEDNEEWIPEKQSKRRKTSKLPALTPKVPDSDDQKPFLSCDICSKRFFLEHRLVAHKRIHDGLKPYPCTVEGCNKGFKRIQVLRDHMKKHDGSNEVYRCETEGCDRVYKNKITLSMHLRKVHKQGPELKSHICEICGKVFKSSASLQKHRYTHKDKSELPFGCTEANCDRRFVNKDKLKEHLMRHAGIKNFVCPYCGMRKTTRHELKCHINYHTLERTWPCRFCSHVCNNAYNLRRHVRIVHERARDFPCRYCDKSFGKPDTRKYHEMTHTGEKPNACDECGKRFAQPTALKTHKKIHLRNRNAASTVETMNVTVEPKEKCTDESVAIPSQLQTSM